jgi:hypothetical protein
LVILLFSVFFFFSLSQIIPTDIVKDMEPTYKADLFIASMDDTEFNRHMDDDARSSELDSFLDAAENQLVVFQETRHPIRAALPIISKWPWTTDVLLEEGKLVDAVNRLIPTNQSEVSPMVLVRLLGIFH